VIETLAARIDDLERCGAALASRVDAIARHPWHVVHDGDAPSGETIE